MKNEFDRWIEFLKPENLKGNLIACSLYIANYESFQDYIIEQVKFFYCSGFDQKGYIFSKDYENKVLSKDKNELYASLLWLKDFETINDEDIETFHRIRKYRNKLAHEMMDILFERIVVDLPKNYSDLRNLRTKIEKWWIVNIEMSTNPDLEVPEGFDVDNIITSSQMIDKIIMDILTGDEKTANYYRNEFIKNRFGKN